MLGERLESLASETPCHVGSDGQLRCAVRGSLSRVVIVLFASLAGFAP